MIYYKNLEKQIFPNPITGGWPENPQLLPIHGDLHFAKHEFSIIKEIENLFPKNSVELIPVAPIHDYLFSVIFFNLLG